MKATAISRRQWLGLGALSLGALALGQYLRRGQPLGRDVSEIMDVPALLEAPGFPFEGPADAAVTMLVFSDYACPVCRQVEPSWREAVREAGDVRVVHRDWPILGPASVRAARVALAADRQGLYAPFHATLMRTGQHGEDAMRAALAAAGGDWARLEADLAAHGEAIDRLLARTARDALQLGFRGTPGYLVGPIRIEGGASERQFADAIERARG
ncbi:MAG: thioredoxin domain-containing protein [Qipengyuania sp.]|nr:thioredoxin domain-containing protein [Qipengyuania sp.]